MTARRSSPLIGPAIAVLTAVWLALSGKPAAQSPQTPQSGAVPPTFRNEVNAVLIDARVTNADGEFVRDLTRDDFHIFEDGRQQTLSLFSLVDLPLNGPPAPVFAGRRVERDVTTNEAADDGRLYVIVLDDAPHGLVFDQWRLMQGLAREFVEHLTDADQVAVVSTSNRPDLAQEFTTNRRRTLETIQRFVPEYGPEMTSAGARPRSGRVSDGDHTMMVTLKAVSDWLGGVPGRRKAVVVFSNRGLSCIRRPHLLVTAQQKYDSEDLLEAAARGMATFYAIAPGDEHFDPYLVNTLGSAPFDRAFDLLSMDVDVGRSTDCDQGLITVARDTGGFALPSDMPGVFDRIVNETSSYYLLGYTPTNTIRDKTFRNVEVRTTRPGVKIVSRSGYTATEAKPRRLTTWSNVPPSLTGVINNPIAVGGLKLTLAAPIFRDTGSQASVAVVLEMRGGQLGFPDRALDGGVSVFMVAADPDGKVKDREFGSLTMTLTEAERTGVQEHGVRLHTALTLKPGRYQLRVGALERDSELKGGTRYDLDVPDFSKEPLAMSGVALLTQERTPTVGKDDRWKSLAGMSPTATRVFSAADHLSSHVEVYDNSGKHRPIAVTTRVVHESGRIVFSTNQNEPAIHHRSPVYQVTTAIPLGSFVPGQYLLMTEASSSAVAGRTVSREVPFSVR